MLILGTRPEAIKLCPLVHALRAAPSSFAVHVCSTGQHRDLLPPVWESFGIEPDSDLGVMSPSQSLAEVTSRMMAAIPRVFEDFQPHFAVVQGDTTTTLCGALSAFYRRVPVGHVEAGLRTGDFGAPFPEEMNRSLVGRIATLHFAATATACGNLLAEGIPADRIHITGNTGIDALRYICDRLDRGILKPRVSLARNEKRRIVVTIHRREALHHGLAAICQALVTLAKDPTLEIVLPLHPNPSVQEAVRTSLAETKAIHLVDPLDYASFVALMRSADLILTDSGGIQEEAPHLGIPVLVLREKTERPEGVTAGLARMVGYRSESILAGCHEVLAIGHCDAPKKSSHAIYGDGQASERIRDLIHSFLGK